jgi:hypothetical protein
MDVLSEVLADMRLGDHDPSFGELDFVEQFLYLLVRGFWAFVFLEVTIDL